jgi:hypothetical protein
VIPFRRTTIVDFEFKAMPGERIVPHTMCALDLSTGDRVALHGEELRRYREAPYSTDAGSLVVAYSATAEMTCQRVLGWRLPVHVVDLYGEFRVATNGLYLPLGADLLGALGFYGFDILRAASKKANQELAARGEPYTLEEIRTLEHYCTEDVDDAAKLLAAMSSMIDWPRALLRGRYCKALAAVELTGVPMDRVMYDTIQSNREQILARLVQQFVGVFPLFEGVRLRRDLVTAFAARYDGAWPTTALGFPRTDRETLEEMSAFNPELSALVELFKARAALRDNSIIVSRDGVNRVHYHPFAADTGRNSTRGDFLFVNTSLLHRLAKPREGEAIAVLDYGGEEFAIGARLSEDDELLHAYESGDPYTAFAVRAGMLHGTESVTERKAIRAKAKACVLASGYGIGPERLAQRIGVSLNEATDLLCEHRSIYCTYWRWVDRVLEFAANRRYLVTVHGWRIQPRAADLRPPKLQNFPVQGAGADLLRLATSFAVERGVNVLALVHDSLFVGARGDDIEHYTASCERAMREAAAAILGGYELRVGVKIVRHPDRYEPDKGRSQWIMVQRILGELQGARGGAQGC